MGWVAGCLLVRRLLLLLLGLSAKRQHFPPRDAGSLRSPSRSQSRLAGKMLTIYRPLPLDAVVVCLRLSSPPAPAAAPRALCHVGGVSCLWGVWFIKYPSWLTRRRALLRCSTQTHTPRALITNVCRLLSVAAFYGYIRVVSCCRWSATPPSATPFTPELSGIPTRGGAHLLIS